MVAIKSILLIFISFIAALQALENPVPSSTDIVAPSQSANHNEVVARSQDECGISWSLDGVVCWAAHATSYLAEFPDLTNSQGSQMAVEEFKEYMEENLLDLGDLRQWWRFVSISPGNFVSNAWGVVGFKARVGSNFDDEPPSQRVLETLVSWMSKWGVLYTTATVRQRPAGFANQPTSRIKRYDSLNERGRTNQCPADINILKYIQGTLPDIDWQKDVRWISECDA